LTHHTDMWSFGVSLLELFTGEVTWLAGEAAAEALEAYVQHGPEDSALPVMPPEVVALLRRCFAPAPESRPADMREIASELVQCYQSATGQPYPRRQPLIVGRRADSLNNRALSLLDLGKPLEAETTWAQAAEIDPKHVETIYNHGLWAWRSARLTDEDLVHQLESAITTQPEHWRAYYQLGLVHLERRDVDAASAALHEAARLAPDEKTVQTALAQLESSPTIRLLHRFGGNVHAVNAIIVTRDGRFALTASGAQDSALGQH
jgi:tetratricopeptide (TPR) repeat protein